MDFVWKLYGNTNAVHVTVALVGVATLNLALPAPPVLSKPNIIFHFFFFPYPYPSSTGAIFCNTSTEGGGVVTTHSLDFHY